MPINKKTDAKELTICPVTSYRDLKAFIDVPWHVYSDDPNWVPPLRLERYLHYSKHNPFFKHGEWQAWIAYKKNRLVGRISAQIDTLHRERYGADTGQFGAIECINDPAVFKTLLQYAEEWLVARHTRQISGPFNLSINQECGVLVEGFHTPPAIMMPHSPKWYGNYLESNGYRPAKDLLAYWINVDFKTPDIMGVLIKKFSNQVHLRTLNRNKFDQEIEILRDIFNDAWSKNWGFVPFTQAEFAELGNSLRWLVSDEYIQIAEVNGEPAAFMAALPNLNEILIDLNGRLFPFGWLKLIKKLKFREIRTGRIPLMGVRKQYHRSPLGVALAFMVIDASRKIGLKRGIKEVELSWILEDNVAMRSMLESIGSKPYKRYRIYEKSL